MTDLIARLEAAEAGSRELDADIGVLIGGYYVAEPRYEGAPVAYGYVDADGRRIEPGHGGDQLIPPFTTSLDAALALASRVLGDKEAMLLLTDLLNHEADASDFDLITVSDLPRLLCARVLRAKGSDQ